jgi:ferredoxin
MPVRFALPDGNIRPTDLCEPQLNLLAHAQTIELDIGSLCGGHGICGGDRVRVPEGARSLLSPPTREEREHLGESGLAAGLRLACQCFPERAELDFVLEALEVATDGSLPDGPVAR